MVRIKKLYTIRKEILRATRIRKFFLKIFKILGARIFENFKNPSHSLIFNFLEQTNISFERY